MILRDDHYYEMQTERSRVLTEKETLENVYQNLLEEHRILLAKYDDANSEKDDALARLREMSREADFRRNDKTDAAMKTEMSRLRLDL
jgi:protein HOOK3